MACKAARVSSETTNVKVGGLLFFLVMLFLLGSAKNRRKVFQILPNHTGLIVQIEHSAALRRLARPFYNYLVNACETFATS
jgi:hypothetical protein